MQLYGIIPPLVTPFDAGEGLDEQALRGEVRYLIERAGVHGLAVGGSTGEGHTLSTDEVRTLVAWTVEEARGPGAASDDLQRRALGVAALPTAAPEWCVALWDAVQQGDHGGGRVRAPMHETSPAQRGRIREALGETS